MRLRPLLAALFLPAAALAQDGADIAVLGEIHDNPAHHLHQAELVAALDPAAVVFEMLTPDQAAAIEGVDRGDAEALAAALGWADSGWPDFALYAPILAATDAPVIGMALPREEVRRAIGEGAAAVFGADAAGWGLGPLPEDLAQVWAVEMQEAHCNALPEEMLPGMVEAQRLRDAHFARVIAETFDETGGPVVVITGNGHAQRDRAIPHVLSIARPDLGVWALGQFEAEPAAGEAALFDAVNVTEPAERDDPCAGF